MLPRLRGPRASVSSIPPAADSFGETFDCGCFATTNIRANAPGNLQKGFSMAFHGLKAIKSHKARSRGSQPARPEPEASGDFVRAKFPHQRPVQNHPCSCSVAAKVLSSSKCVGVYFIIGLKTHLSPCSGSFSTQRCQCSATGE